MMPPQPMRVTSPFSAAAKARSTRVERSLVRRVLVLADVDADHRLVARAADVMREGVGADAVQAEAVDDGLRRCDAEKPGPRVARLRPGGHAAELEEAEAERGQRGDV